MLAVVADSAREFWRLFRKGDAFVEGTGVWGFLEEASHDPTPAIFDAMSDVPSDNEVTDLLERELRNLRAPVDIGVTPHADRSHTPLKTPHLISAPPPSGAFVRLSPNAYVSSPEYSFVQTGGSFDVLELIWSGTSLCSTFAINTDATGGFVESKPITTRSRLERFLKRSSRIRGVAKAKRAAKFVRDGAASPMEAVITMLLCLPCALGGFGLRAPEINKKISPGTKGIAKLGQTGYMFDLVWPESKFVLEYDGEACHTGLERISHDSVRRSDLAYLGYSVFVMTKQQVYDRYAFEQCAIKIAHGIGARLRHRRSLNWQRDNAALRQKLLYDRLRPGCTWA